MRVAVSSLVLLVAALAASPDVRAEVASLGGVALGQERAVAGTIKTTVYGCAGRLYPDIDRKKKVIKVRFESDKCADVAAAVAAITKEFGAAPIVSAEGDKLWEGKRASLILSPSLSNYPTSPVLLLVPPGPGSKRTCWANDGFAAFWKAFVRSVVAGKPAAVATSFAFPLKDQDEKVKFKDAAAFAARWRSSSTRATPRRSTPASSPRCAGSTRKPTAWSYPAATATSPPRKYAAPGCGP